ncbi:NAC domain-containing protein [Tanacetum coccineum]
MCPNGNRPKRTTKKNGFWKTGNSKVAVCDVKQRRLGYKRNLAFYDEKKRKTTWLMTEYTTTDPNLPVGNGTKLNNFVLCKIYKKEKKGDRNMANEDEGNEEQNQPDYEPSPRRRRLNPGSNLPNEPQHVWIQEANHHLVAPLQPANCYQQEVNNIDTEALTSGPDQPFTAHTLSANQDIGSNHDAMTSQTRMNTSHYPITNNSSSTQPQLVNPHAMTETEMTQSLCGSSTCDDQQNQSTMMATDEFLDGASSFTEMEAEQLPYCKIDAIQSSVTSTNCPPDSTADQVPQLDEDFFELNPTDEFSLIYNFSLDDQVPELPANNDTTTPLYDEDLFDFSRDEFPQLLPLTDEDLSNFNTMLESDIFWG